MLAGPYLCCWGCINPRAAHLLARPAQPAACVRHCAPYPAKIPARLRSAQVRAASDAGDRAGRGSHEARWRGLRSFRRSSRDRDDDSIFAEQVPRTWNSRRLTQFQGWPCCPGRPSGITTRSLPAIAPPPSPPTEAVSYAACLRSPALWARARGHELPTWPAFSSRLRLSADGSAGPLRSTAKIAE